MRPTGTTLRTELKLCTSATQTRLSSERTWRETVSPVTSRMRSISGTMLPTIRAGRAA
jgi:hypothetical protein